MVSLPYRKTLQDKKKSWYYYKYLKYFLKQWLYLEEKKKYIMGYKDARLLPWNQSTKGTNRMWWNMDLQKEDDTKYYFVLFPLWNIIGWKKQGKNEKRINMNLR